ncbi:DUF4383 domain-containing protein [Candidatus Woesearchaeota archaeon]|nr:DUF4383 domain-containing protein [Candidatus Woesearchaeota archaeon]
MKTMKINNLQKYYTRIIGVFFLLVAISLIFDFINFGHRAETWHKIFHVLLGIIIIKFGWNNKNFWKPFCIANGAFFTFVALFGLTFPNFANLDAFNSIDTLLHSIAGISGLIIGFMKSKI